MKNIDTFLDEYNIEQESLSQQEQLNKAKLSEDFLKSKSTKDKIVDYATGIAAKAIEGIDLLGEAALTKIGLEDEETFSRSVEAYENLNKMTHGIDATTGMAEESIATDIASGLVPLLGGAKLTNIASRGLLGKELQDAAINQLAQDAKKSALRNIIETEVATGVIGALQGAQPFRVDPLTGKQIVSGENLADSLVEGFGFNATLGLATRAGEISRSLRGNSERGVKDADLDYWIDDENNFEFSKINPDKNEKEEIKSKYGVNVKDIKDDKEFASDNLGNIYVDKELKELKDKDDTAKEIYKILIDHEAGHINRFDKDGINIDIAKEEALRHIDTIAQLTNLYQKASNKELVKKYYNKALEALDYYISKINDENIQEKFYNTFDEVSLIAKDKDLPDELKEAFISDVLKENLGDISYKGKDGANKLNAFKNVGEPPEWFDDYIEQRIKEKVGEAAIERQLKENSNQSDDYGLDYSSYDIADNFNINAKLVADFLEKAYQFNMKRIEENYRPDDDVVKWLKSEDGKRFVIDSAIEDLGRFLRTGKNKHFFLMRDGKTVFVKGVNINKLYDEMLRNAKKYTKSDRAIDLLKGKFGDKIEKSPQLRKEILEDYRRYLQDNIYDYMEKKKLTVDDVNKDEALKKMVKEYEDFVSRLDKKENTKKMLGKVDEKFIKNYDEIKKELPDTKELDAKKQRIIKKEHIKEEQSKKIETTNKEQSIKFAKEISEGIERSIKEKIFYDKIFQKATERERSFIDTKFDDIKLLPKEIDIKSNITKYEGNEKRKNKAQSNNGFFGNGNGGNNGGKYGGGFLNEETGRFELRYIRGIDALYNKLFKKFGAIKNRFKIEEGMPYIDDVIEKISKGKGVNGVAIKANGKGYAFADTKALQAKAAIHEFLHLVYKEKSEEEIKKLTDDIFNYLLTFKEFRQRINYFGEIKKNVKVNKEAMQYILGNKDMRQILFGRQTITDKIDDINAIVSNIIIRLFNIVGGEKIAKEFKKLENKLPKALFDLIQEAKGVRQSDTIRILTDYKKAKKAIYDKLSEVINNGIDKALNFMSDDELKSVFLSGLFREVNPYDLFNKYGDNLEDAYNALKEKFKDKMRFIEDSASPFEHKKFSIRTIEDVKKVFKSNWQEGLELLVLHRLKKSGHFDILNDKSKLELLKPIFELFDDIKTELDEHSRVIGYAPFVLEGTYDLRVAFSEAMKEELIANGYKTNDGYLFYKRDAQEGIGSEVIHPKDYTKKAGFNIIVDGLSAVKEIEKFFNGKDLRVRKIGERLGEYGQVITKYEITYQPKLEDIKKITSLKDDARSLILKTYQKMLKEQFNRFELPERILQNKDLLFNEEDGIFSNEKKEGFVKFKEEDAKILNKLLSAKTGINFSDIYVRRDVKDLILSRELLPENELLKKIVKIRKGLIARLKWNLTGVSVSAYNNAIMSGLLATGYFGVNPKHILRVIKDTRRDYKAFKALKEKFINDDSIDKKDIEGYFRKFYNKNIFVEIMLDGKLASLFDDVDILIGKDGNYFNNAVYEELKKIENKFDLVDAKKLYEAFKIATVDRSTKFGKFLSAFYSDIDLFSRVISYRFLKERFGKEKAIEMVNDMFIDYSISSRPTTTALDLTFAPFLAWTLRMQGGLFRLAKDRPLNFGAMIALYLGLNALLDDEKYKDLNDEFAGDLRIDSWFIHKTFMDDMILHTNVIAQTFEGKMAKMMALTIVPKTYEEAYAVWKGHRDKFELLGFNFINGYSKVEILRRKREEVGYR